MRDRLQTAAFHDQQASAGLVSPADVGAYSSSKTPPIEVGLSNSLRPELYPFWHRSRLIDRVNTRTNFQQTDPALAKLTVGVPIQPLCKTSLPARWGRRKPKAVAIRTKPEDCAPRDAARPSKARAPKPA